MSKNMNIDKSKQFSQFFEAQKCLRKIDFLILHHIEANSADHAIKQLVEHGVSAHFLIDETGKIFELVDENNIAYHAGVSFWNGQETLNKNSIGIEFINKSPFNKVFEKSQIEAGVILSKYLLAKYNISAQNVLGHSDIGYNKETGLLNRKQDPSHLFDWKFFAENGVGIFPQVEIKEGGSLKLGDKSNLIAEVKEKLQKFGYRVMNSNDEFDLEMQSLAIVFNRRFLGIESDVWSLKSQQILSKLP